MKKIVVTLCCLIASMQIGGREMLAFDYGDVGPPGPNSVHIGKTAIVMPLGKILLVRKGKEYCAVRFTEFWTGKTKEDLYARYESYCLGSKTRDLSEENVQVRKEKLSFPKPRGIGRLAFSFGNKEIKCGAIRLLWSGNGAVHFYGQGQDQGDYGIELAPTKWNELSEVNVLDTRLRWYRYDPERKRITIPVDNLW